MKELKEMIKREASLNNTYEVKINLRNVSPNQLEALGLIVDILESEGEVLVKKFDHQND